MARGRDVLEQVWQHLQAQINVLQADVEALKSKIAGSDMPVRATMLHPDSLVLSGSAISASINAAAFMNTVALQSPAVILDSFTNSFSVKSGTYTLRVYGLTNTNSGIITWYVDNVVVGTTDWYGAALTYGVQSFSFTIDTDGTHVLKGVVASANPSSSGYTAYLSAMTVIPQVD